MVSDSIDSSKGLRLTKTVIKGAATYCIIQITATIHASPLAKKKTNPVVHARRNHLLAGAVFFGICSLMYCIVLTWLI